MKKILFLYILFSVLFGQITSLENQTIGDPDDTFFQLLRLEDNTGVNDVLSRIHDGVGDTTALYISHDSVKVAGVFQATQLVVTDSAFIDTLEFNTIYGLDSLNVDSLNFVPDLELTTHTATGGAHHTATVSGDISHDAINDVSTSDHHVKTVDTNLDSSGVDALNFVPDLEFATFKPTVRDTIILVVDSTFVDGLNFVPDNEKFTNSDETDQVWVSDSTDYGKLSDNETIVGNWINTSNPWADNEIASSGTWNALNTNVSTSLTLDTPTATTVPINSDGSSPDITLIEATTTTAGLLGADKWDEIVANSLKETNTDDQKIDVFSISGDNVQLSLEDDGEATKTVDISSTTAVTANTAKVTYVQNVRDGGVSISTVPSDIDFLGADFAVVDTNKPDSVEVSIVDSGIDHDQTTNYDGNEHVDHTGVDLTAGDGLRGGGTIASNRTFTVNIDFDGGLETVDDSINVKLDGSSLSKSSTGLKINSISGFETDPVWVSDSTDYAVISHNENITGDYQFSGYGSFGLARTEGTLHIHTASSGAATAHTNYNDLIVENSQSAGITILTPDANASNVVFGSPSDSVGAYINWNYSADEFLIAANKAGASTIIMSGIGVDGITLDGSQNTTFAGDIFTSVNTNNIGSSGTPFNLVYADSIHANWFGGSDFELGESGSDITIDADSLKGEPVWDGNFVVTGTVDGIDIATDVGANTAKNTNVSTALSIGTTTTTTVAITSDGGADDVVIPAAINGTAGLLTDAKWDEIVANTSLLNVTPGTATASKALVVDANKDITLGTGDLTATNLTGTLQTAAQTNITSLGTLTNLSSGAITSTGKFATTLTTEQLRLNYDATNYAHFTVDIEGRLTITTVDADAAEGDIILAPDGNVGIGTTSPGVILHIDKDTNLASASDFASTLIATSDNPGAKAMAGFFGADGTVGGPIFNGYKARGTIVSPGISQNGDTLFGISGYGYDIAEATNTYKFGAAILFKRDSGTGSTGRIPGKILFNVAPGNGSENINTVMEIDKDGNLDFSGTTIDMVSSGTTLTVGVGVNNGTVSAGIFTDRTPFYDGDALKDIKNIKGNNGRIDHKSLPLFVQVQKDETTERNIGNMISINVKALQQLIDINEAQQIQIDDLTLRLEVLE